VDFQVRISQAALADLETIVGYSWSTFPRTAERFGSALLDLVNLLGRFPYIGSQVAGQQGIRQLVYTPILIYYRVDEVRGEVEILHLRHAKRQPQVT
jgi:plasmid stabilization system protein ParE